MENRIDITIYSSSHGPSPKYNSKIIQPIQVGKSINHYDYGLNLDDANGENISSKNPYYCELTAQYWAWKNDHTSTHFGFLHYRRHLNFSSKKFQTDPWGCITHPIVDKEYHEKFSINDSAINKLVSEYDLILPEKWDVTTAGSSNNYEHYKNGEFLHIEDYDTALEILQEKYPEYISYAKEFNTSNVGYYTNIFVMQKELFNKYSTWLFSILEELENRISIGHYNNQERRVVGHISERLFNIFIKKAIDDKKLSFIELQRTFVTHVPKVTAIEKKQDNALPFVICFDDNYAHSAGALLDSIISHSSNEKQYEINLFCDAVTQDNRDNFLSLIEKHENFSIRFVDTSSLFDSSKMNTSEHFTAATYARLFIPSVYKNYEKVVFIDADMIVCDDVAKLFEIDLQGKKIGAVKDLVTEGFIKFNHAAPEPFSGYTSYTYLKNFLGMKNPDNYFQAGLLIMNLKLMHADNDAEGLQSLIYQKKYWYHDQDILNKHFEDDVFYLPINWNVYHGNGTTESFFPNLKLSSYQSFLEARKNIKIIHFAGDQKPWINANVDYASFYFKHLKNTPWKLLKKPIEKNNIPLSSFEDLKRHVLYIINEYVELSNILNKNTNINNFRRKQRLINRVTRIAPRGSLRFRAIRKVYMKLKRGNS